MISILIPTYNYNISNLVNTLHKQGIKTGVPFEIICFDDHSKTFTAQNKAALKTLNHTKYIVSKQNIGRTAARQKLSDAATFNWLLFLDADVIPKSKTFIKQYLNQIPLNYDAVFGGFAYKKTAPHKNAILRWEYGKRYEEVDASKRNLKPHQLIISANFLIKKTVFNTINAKLNRKCYGLDNYFAALLKQSNAHVLHINNEVFHHGLESSQVYLNKSEECIHTLLWLYNTNKMHKHNNKLLGLFVRLKKVKLNYVMNGFYTVFKHAMKKNLLGHRPNMLLLQFYKLTYICHEDLNA